MKRLVLLVLLLSGIARAVPFRFSPLGISPEPEPAPVPWTPADLGSGLAIWYDAEDADTLWADTSATTPATASGTVARWDDKSGNSNHATQSDAGFRPVNGGAINTLNAIRGHDTTTPFMNAPSTAVRTGFAVAQLGATAAVKILTIGSASTTFSSEPEFFVRYNAAETISFDNNGPATAKYRMNGGAESGSVVGADEAVVRSETPFLIGATYDSGFDLIALIGRSGGLVGPIASYRVGEIIWLSGVPSDEDRQKIEGYLAHKWGLAGNLPSDHPYKHAAPIKQDVEFPTNGLVSYWSMDSRSGDDSIVFDTWGSNDGTVGGNPYFNSDSGVRGDGVDLREDEFTYIGISRPDFGTNGFSVAFWTYVPPLATWNRTMFGRNSNTPELELAATSGTGNYAIRMQTDIGGSTITENFGSEPRNTWRHVIVTYDGIVIKGYINGEERYSRDQTGVLANAISTYNIGTRLRTSDALSFTGKMDEVAVWNRALSSNEVSELYNNGAGRFYTP